MGPDALRASPTTERELTDPVELCTPDGRLNPAARGWSRRPLHVCALPPGGWGRRKRWHHFAVTSPEHVCTLTFADLDYLGLAAVALLDVATGRTVEKVAVRPLGWGAPLPDVAGGGDVAVAGSGLELAFLEEPAGTRLVAASRRLRVELLARRPAGHETLNVVVPFGERRFQFTSKQTALPAEGLVVADGRRCVFPAGQSFACLDFGRGLWPWRTTWNWAAAGGVQDGRVVGLNLGGRWTDGTGATENGVCLDGRLTKISDDARFDYDRADFRRPWGLRAGDAAALRFVPFAERELRLELGVAAARLHLCFGRFSGRVAGVEVRDLLGWAEEFQARW